MMDVQLEESDYPSPRDLPTMLAVEVKLAEQPHRDCPDSDLSLLGTLLINGVPHHLELIPVRTNHGDADAEGYYQEPQEAIYEDERRLNALMNFDGGSEPLRTIVILGQEYIAVVLPYRD